MATRYIHLPHAIGELATASLDGGPAQTIQAYADVPEVVEYMGTAGRVDVVSGILSDPSAGVAIARADGKTTLDFRDLTAAQDVTADITSGGAALVHVAAPAQKRGHPSGEHYWLPVDGNNRFVCEPGQRHRKWYWSKSSSALTKAQIAANAGVSEATVTGAWLLTRPQYGGTPQTAIHADLFSMVRSSIVIGAIPGRSDHHFLERGFDYSTLDWGGFCGEDELHPMLVRSWGTGTDPVIRLWSNFMMLPYTVVQDVQTLRDPTQTIVDSVTVKFGYALAFDHVEFGRGSSFEYTSFVTIREMTSLRGYMDKPIGTITFNGKTAWNPKGGNHITGIYTYEAAGILVDSCLIDHTGWGEGYDFNGDATMPQPTTMYSHSLYFAGNVFDITVRDNLLSRAASCALQMRSGGHFEGNLLVDNNIQMGVNSFSGLNQYNNVIDNVAFSSGYKRVAYDEGGYNWGYDVNGPMSSMIGNVIAHSANPDDQAEIASKPDANHDSYRDSVNAEITSIKLHNDTQVWAWGKFPDTNVTGLDAAVLDQTTIQRRAGTRLGKASGTIAEYVAHAAAAPSIGAIVREDVRWTKERFGRPIPARTTPADLVFRPDPRTDGFRWDNRLNWSTLDRPGTHVADSVDLDGHRVRFGTVNADIAALKSDGGLLDVTSGKLKIGTLTDAADMIVRLAGQVWIGAANQPLSVEAVSGRLMLSGAASALDLYAGGQAQALLGPDATIPAGKALIVSGQRVRVGWDGTGSAALAVAGTLEFRRGIEITVDPQSTNYIRYAHRHIGKTITGSTSGFTARVAAVERIHDRGITFKVWLADVQGQPVVGDTFQVSPMRNGDGPDTPNTLTVSAVGVSGIAPLQRFRSGAVGDGLTEPTVAATVTLAPTAQVVVPTGLTPSSSHDMTGAGVTVVNQGATLPAGVTLTGGKLVYTVPA